MHHRGRRLLLSAVALSSVVVGCSSDGGSEGAGRTAVAAATTDLVVPGPDDLVVAMVADSEVPPPVGARIDAAPGIAVVASELHDGFRMDELDPFADAALAEDPDVLVYSGSTNDLSSGPAAVLAGLEERLTRYVADTCVVMAVPVFRYQPGTTEEVAQRTEGTRVLERAVAATGAKVASYLDVSIAMAADGRSFFAEGELGDLHPGEAAHEDLAAAILEQVEACRPA